MDSTLQFTYEVLVYRPETLNYDKKYNRKYFASCNYSITGDAYWNPESGTVQVTEGNQTAVLGLCDKRSNSNPYTVVQNKMIYG